jgi:hypothetical protein
MATKLDDGTLLIQGGIDGPFEQLGSMKVKGVSPVGADPLLIHQIQHGRPQSLSHADRQARIRELIQELRDQSLRLGKKLTFAQAWERLQRTNPELFNAD